MSDSNIRKSVEEYVKRRLKELPSELKMMNPQIQQTWKFENELDFLYGYYVGKLEEATIHYLLKARRASSSVFDDTAEVKEVIEIHRQEIKEIISKCIHDSKGS